MSDEPMVRVGGLWMNKTGAVLSGPWGSVRLVAFRNDRKTSEKSPDWTLYLQQQPPRSTDAASPTRQVKPDTEEW